MKNMTSKLHRTRVKTNSGSTVLTYVTYAPYRFVRFLRR
jgi:hypothetical protein